MFSLKSSLLGLVPLLSVGIHGQIQPPLGSGNIIVVKGSALNATLADRVGCLDVNGRLTLNNCAVFTQSTAQGTVSTSAGSCTFWNPTQEINTDSDYGKGDHAFFCGDNSNTSEFPTFYTLDDAHVFLCQGNLDCLYDTKRAPAAGDALSIWPYRWGSTQLGITPGHISTLYYFQKV